MRDTIQVARTTKKAKIAFTGNSVFTLKVSSCGLTMRWKTAIHNPGKTMPTAAQRIRRLRSGRPQGGEVGETSGGWLGMCERKNTPFVGGFWVFWLIYASYANEISARTAMRGMLL